MDLLDPNNPWSRRPWDNHAIAALSKEKGNIAFKAEDYATAKSLYSHAMDFDPSNHIYPLNRSQANLMLGRWDEAESDATKALDLSPHNLKALFRRSRARKELGKWEEARADIRMFTDNGGKVTVGAYELNAIADAESSPPSEGTSYISSGLDAGLANLHLQDDSSFFSVHTSTVPGIQNGKGAFATRDIQRGDLILSERAIFSMPAGSGPSIVRSIGAAVQNLSPIDLDSYLSLHNSHKTCSCFSTPLLGIFTTNSFEVIDYEMGICLKASRFNHSCSPNARFSYNSNTDEIRIYALRTIPRGEEIFVAYFFGIPLYGSPRHSRQATLRTTYHFTCACSVCSLPEAESKRSDARRQRVAELLEDIRDLNGPYEGVQCLNAVVEAIRLLREDGYLADMHDFTKKAGPICATHSDWVSASYWAGLTYHSRVAEFGWDNPIVRMDKTYEIYRNPRLSSFAGLGHAMDLTRIRL